MHSANLMHLVHSLAWGFLIFFRRDILSVTALTLIYGQEHATNIVPKSLLQRRFSTRFRPVKLPVPAYACGAWAAFS